jgi:hypothetical protein
MVGDRSLKMRELVLLLFCVATVACGSETAEDVAQIGWMFNYRDYTNTSKPDDMRGCDNQPANQIDQAYDAIAAVHVAIVDPTGQVPGIDKEYDCSLGYGDKRVSIRGIVKQAYNLTVEARTASGVVLYATRLENYDLTTMQSDTYTLPTSTGELHFFPRYQGSLTCPSNVTQLRYSLFKKAAGNTDTNASVTGVADPACEQGLSRELYIRGIPVTIEAGTFQTSNDFKLKLEALDSGNSVVYCGINSSRAVRPGNDSLNSDESLNPGSSCP